MPSRNRLAAEFVGTFPFGLTVLTGALAFGPSPGGHFNQAVTVGPFTAERFAGCVFPPFAGESEEAIAEGNAMPQVA